MVFVFASVECLNPYFIGLSILIIMNQNFNGLKEDGLNPYFIGLSILITTVAMLTISVILVSILILLDYLFLLWRRTYRF